MGERSMSDCAMPVPEDDPLMKAWKTYTTSPEYENTMRWVGSHPDGSLWGAFMAGFAAATKRAGNLHESINPASDAERLAGSPGAGAMGAVIEYRDLIRKTVASR